MLIEHIIKYVLTHLKNVAVLCVHTTLPPHRHGPKYTSDLRTHNNNSFKATETKPCLF